MVNKQQNQSQLQKFVKTTHALGCDESEEAFAAKLKAIASRKPVENEIVKKKTKKGKRNA